MEATGTERTGERRQSQIGKDWIGMEWAGRQGMVRRGLTGRGSMRHVTAGVDRMRESINGCVRIGLAGKARCGKDR
jgi:hypothetical protein